MKVYDLVKNETMNDLGIIYLWFKYTARFISQEKIHFINNNLLQFSLFVF